MKRKNTSCDICVGHLLGHESIIFHLWSVSPSLLGLLYSNLLIMIHDAVIRTTQNAKLNRQSLKKPSLSRAFHLG